MAIERGARKKERCGDVLNALVRNDQDLKNIALALCKPKGCLLYTSDAADE